MTTWRAKHFVLPLSRKRRLIFTVRRFYSAKQRRSQKYRQLVIDLDLGPFKELAIRQQVKRRVTRQKVAAFWQLRASWSYVLIGAGLVGAGFSSVQLVATKVLEPPKTFAAAVSTEGLASKALPYSPPTHLSIPSVGIDVDLISVGQDSSGAIQMPPLFSWVAGWYKYSPAPGQVGPAIIVGHVDTYKGISVFWRLRDVQRGDAIHITRADGRTVNFKITTLAQYDQSNFPTQTVYGNIAYPGLRLITCGGTFDTSTGHYTQNTVVSAYITS